MEKENMKKHFTNRKQIFTAVCISLILCFLTACNNSTNNAEPNNTITIRGGLITESQIHRTAVPSFSLPAGYSYTISACYGTAEGKPPVYTWDTENQISGTVDSSTMSYTINLTQAGHWKITLSLTDSSDNNTELVSEEIDVTRDAPYITKDFEIGPAFLTDTTSSISLKISRTQDSSDIQNVTWHWADSSLSLTDSTKKFDEGVIADGLATVTFEYTDVPVGSYDVQFIISTINGDEYCFNDVINVSTIFTSDTWYGECIHLTKDSITNTYSFIVSNELLARQQKYRPYRSEFDNTLYLLYSEQAKEYIEPAWDNNLDRSVPTYDPNYGAKGAQVFTSIDGGEKITKPMFETSNFCFGDGCIYALEMEGGSYRINKYIESYAGYTKSSEFLNVPDFCFDSTDISPITYTNGSIYLFYKDNSNEIRICKIFVADGLNGCASNYYGLDNLTTVPTTIAVTASTDSSEQTSGIIFYSTSDSGNDTLYRQPFTFNETTPEFTLSTSDVKSYELTSSTLGFSCYSDIHYGDLMIKQNPTDNKDYLYALIYSYGLRNRLYLQYEQEGTVWYEDTYQGLYVSNGGVLQFDVEGTSTNLEPTQWSIGGESQTILGWHTKTADQDYYDSNTGTPNKVLSEGEVYTVQPPYDDENEPPVAIGAYLFGARKFIARKPGVLVFADDGGFYTYGLTSIYAQNRVVTLNLSDSSLSITKVNVSFSTQYELVLPDPENPESFWFELK